MSGKTIIKSFIISTFFVYVVLIAGKVYSETIDISGNASDSNNSININQKNSNTVNQSNSADVNNSVNATSDTGGNSINDGVGGGSIKTGDATTNVNIKNQLNTNAADVNCKNCPTPTPKPKPSPTDPGKPTSTPTPAPSGNDGDGDGDGGDGGEGGAPQAPAVLGLSAASGESSLFKIIPGLISILLGFNLLRKKC